MIKKVAILLLAMSITTVSYCNGESVVYDSIDHIVVQGKDGKVIVVKKNRRSGLIMKTIKLAALLGLAIGADVVFNDAKITNNMGAAFHRFKARCDNPDAPGLWNAFVGNIKWELWKQGNQFPA